MDLIADISDPGTEVIAGPDLIGFVFYVGRAGFTPHIWTGEQIARQTLRYAIPAWVPDLDPPALNAANGANDGQDCAADLHALGVPAGVAVRVDLETATGAGVYLRNFRAQLNLAGYWFGSYGSASTVFSNPHGGAGWWVADWTGHPHDYPHPFVTMTQYADAAQAGTPWDLSEAAPGATRHFWDRRPPTWQHDAAADLENAIAEATVAAGHARMALTALKQHGG